MTDSLTQIVLAVLAFLTGVTAWYAKIKIAEARKPHDKPPNEILFDGYEKLLRRYQSLNAQLDNKVQELEVAFEHVQLELNKALVLVDEMKNENTSKDSVIKTLESQLLALKETVQAKETG